MKISLKIKAVSVAVALLSISLLAKSQSVEYLVKASFIEKFARFTEWAPNSIGDSFVIGVLGDSPFSTELETLSSKTKIKSKPIAISYIKDYRNVSGCNVLFICSSEKNNLSKIISSLGNSNVMLVGDTPGYAEKGVHFNFYLTAKGTIHFEINTKALVSSGLKVDIQLLSIGKIVK